MDPGGDVPASGFGSDGSMVKAHSVWGVPISAPLGGRVNHSFDDVALCRRD